MTDSEKLGIACRFKGLKAVNELLNRGVNFTNGDHAVSLLNVSEHLLYGQYRLRNIELGGEFTENGKKYALLPASERIEIYRLLKENAEKCGLDSGRLFYYALLSNDTEMIAAMRENGERLPEDVVETLTKGSRTAEWSDLCHTFDGMSVEEFCAVVGNISRELDGKRLHYSEIMFCCIKPILYEPRGLDLILERFDQQKMKKGRLMKRFIDDNESALLEIVSRHGWLKIPKKRDEMIKYASDNGKTEALAFLLDLKNRTADLAKEQAAAEKRMLRELNANPNSVTELKKSWGFVKNGGGTVTITSYKGDRTEIIVPAKLGKDIVTEIGCGTFTSLVLPSSLLLTKRRVPQEQLELRHNITRVALPENIEIIGSYAFAHCHGLKDINIPESIREINDFAFFSCHTIEEIVLPQKISVIGSRAFCDCPKLTVTVVKGSYAEKYCKENQIKFKYKESTQ